jgi:hypothetical protein
MARCKRPVPRRRERASFGVTAPWSANGAL